MRTRRQVLRFTVGALSGLCFLYNPLLKGMRWAWATGSRVILPKGTETHSLISKNPANLDARNLEITPLEHFGTMGLKDHVVDLDSWRLEVTGEVRKPLSLTYSQLIALPSMERRVLQICPGFFANHGQWKGISIGELFRRAEAEEGVTHVTVSGPEGSYPKVVTFPMEEIRSDKIFLANQVNGKPLPQKHGFPLRLVAEDRYGYDWVKYVCLITAEKK